MGFSMVERLGHVMEGEINKDEQGRKRGDTEIGEEMNDPVSQNYTVLDEQGSNNVI